MPVPNHPKHLHNIADKYNGDGVWVTVAGHQFSHEVGSRAMGIDWMTNNELAEAVPPDYAQYVVSWYNGVDRKRAKNAEDGSAKGV